MVLLRGVAFIYLAMGPECVCVFSLKVWGAVGLREMAAVSGFGSLGKCICLSVAFLVWTCAEDGR